MRFLDLAALVCAVLVLTSTVATADCICLYKGGEVKHGQTACLVTAQGRELARCEKSLNMSTWKFLGEPCPTAQIDEPLTVPDKPNQPS
jgi:hypothetical protein